MNQDQYRAQVDAVSFSPDFQERTLARLAALDIQKETKPMHKKTTFRTALIAAAVAAALCVTAFAANMMLAPKDVAQRAGNQTLAAAFESDKAVSVNETRTVGDYQVTLMGLVSGDGLSQVDGVSRDKTYAVLSYSRTDSVPIEDDMLPLTATPLVEGYAPWEVNAWTLSGAVCYFAESGVLYYLFECDDLEPFADHAVYLAVYPGAHIPPNAELFSFDGNAIALQGGQDGALFTLPLDRAKADPRAAQMLLDGMFRNDDEEDLPALADGVEPVLAPGDDSERKVVYIADDPDHPGAFLITENS